MFRKLIRLLLRVPVVYSRRLVCAFKGHRDEVIIFDRNERACVWCGWNTGSLQEECDG